MKIGLVLEGGGARGSYHVGALKAFRKRGIKFDAAVGTSIGSINAAFVAMDDFKTLYKMWNHATAKAFFDIDDKLVSSLKEKKVTKELLYGGVKEALRIIKNLGVDTKKLRTLLTENINEDKLRQSPIDYGLVTFKVNDMKPLEVFKKDIKKGKLIDYIIASSYHPIFRYEKIIDDAYYVDGSVYSRCPVSMLQNKDFDIVYVVKSYKWNIKPVIDDKKTKLVYIKPRENLDSVIFFTPNEVREGIKKGYYDTLKVLDNLDGIKYNFTVKSSEFYDEMVLNKKIMKFYPGKYNKDKIIKVVEKLMAEFEFTPYRVYNIKRVINRLKFFVKSNHKYYEFINNLKVGWF